MPLTTEQLRNLGLLNNQSLLPEWEARLKLHAEGDKLCDKGARIRSEGVWAKGDKLYVKGAKLWAEGAKLHAEGYKLWSDAVIERFGPRATIEWTSDGCIVDGKETYHATHD